MKQLTVVGLILCLAGAGWSQRRGFRWPSRGVENASLAKNQAEKRVLDTLEQAQRGGDVFQNVSNADGRLLRVLAEAAGAKTVVEIGTSTGLSGLWLSLALLETGGRLTTFEIDTRRAATARANFKKAGVDHLVTQIEGDAHRTVARLKDPIDVVFIDANKEGYLDYLNKLLPLVRPGGLVLAHNVQSAPDYLRAVTSNAELETVFAGDGGDLGITLKKR
ncbi:MAG TPA: class I SAM-dependent methyltransferase [Bryobacteraceae bacterium]|nr:class I SAM-dependent methyltransferase [Bryobacteraceae bacterium]